LELPSDAAFACLPRGLTGETCRLVDDEQVAALLDDAAAFTDRGFEKNFHMVVGAEPMLGVTYPSLIHQHAAACQARISHAKLLQ
jgi:hypothetical protein